MSLASARRPASPVTSRVENKPSVTKAHLKAVKPQPAPEPVPSWWREKQPDYIVELTSPYTSPEPRYNFLA